MIKKYIVRLTAEERRTLQEIIKKQLGSSLKVRRAQALLKADADGPGWTDSQIAEALDLRSRTMEKLRERFVTEGFDVAVHGKPRETPATAKRLNGKQEAKLIAMLQAKDGATVEEIAKAFGWQNHTVRGALFGAVKKKLGLDILSEKVEGRGRVYRIGN